MKPTILCMCRNINLNKNTRLKIWNFFLFGFLFALIASGIVSCTHDEIEGNPVTNDVLTRFTIRTPAAQIPLTRDGQTQQECVIDRLHVLVFTRTSDSAPYVLSQSAPAIGYKVDKDDYEKGSFTALLKSTKGINTRVVILANINEPSLTEGTTYDVIKKALKVGFSIAGGNIMRSIFPMTGEIDLPTGLNTETPAEHSVKMLRSIAKVDVVDAVNNPAKFVLKSIRVFRPRKSIQVMPNELSTNATGGPCVTEPSVPDAASTNELFYPVNEPMPREEAVGGTSNFLNRVYIPESDAISDGSKQTLEATCIIIGGSYAGSSDTYYYRVDFDIDENKFGEILRNHHYIISIEDVQGPGWTDEEEAAKNRSTQMTVTVEKWDEDTIHMYFDGYHYFGVSSRNILLEGAANSTGSINIDTDLSDFKMEFCDVNGNPLSPPNPSGGPTQTTMDSDRYRVTIGKNGEKYVFNFVALKTNSGPGNQTQYMVVYANRWKIIIKIEQKWGIGGNPSRIINVISSYEIGFLGTGNRNAGKDGWDSSDFGGYDYSKYMRRILNNPINFGPSGKVLMNDWNFVGVKADNEINQNGKLSLTAAKLATCDILVLVNNTRLNASKAQEVKQWLEGSKNRVLFLFFDSNSSNIELLNLYTSENVIGSLDYSFKGHERFLVDIQSTPENEFFTETGPFPADFDMQKTQYYIEDKWWGTIRKTAQNPDLVPIITVTNPTTVDSKSVPSSDNNSIIMAVDIQRRIVFSGDSEIFSYDYNNIENARYGKIQYNRSSNEINNFGKVLTNVWAWAVGVVVGE